MVRTAVMYVQNCDIKLYGISNQKHLHMHRFQIEIEAQIQVWKRYVGSEKYIIISQYQSMLIVGNAWWLRAICCPYCRFPYISRGMGTCQGREENTQSSPNHLITKIIMLRYYGFGFVLLAVFLLVSTPRASIIKVINSIMSLTDRV